MKPLGRDRLVVELLFAIGAILVLVGLAYAIRRRWPTLDPLASAATFGIGLLLIVIYERLGTILRELQSIAAGLERLRRDSASPAAGTIGASSDSGGARLAAKPAPPPVR